MIEPYRKETTIIGSQWFIFIKGDHAIHWIDWNLKPTFINTLMHYLFQKKSIKNRNCNTKCCSFYSDVNNWSFLFSEASESIPQVFINNTNATFVMVGSDFSLECFIRTEIGVFYQSHWDYPSKPVSMSSFIRRFILYD